MLSSAIADFILKKGLPYSLSNDPLLERVIKAARTAPQNFKPPQPKEIGGRYLDVSSARYERKNAHIIEDVAKKYLAAASGEKETRSLLSCFLFLFSTELSFSF